MYKPAKLISTFAGLALCGTIAATAAQAETIIWDTDGACASGFACNSSARVFMGSDGTTKVTAKAWSFNPSSGSISEADTGHWIGGGLGAINSGESGSSPNHTVDNYGRYDMMAFFFDDVVDLDASACAPTAIRTFPSGSAPFPWPPTSPGRR